MKRQFFAVAAFLLSTSYASALPRCVHEFYFNQGLDQVKESIEKIKEARSFDEAKKQAGKMEDGFRNLAFGITMKATCGCPEPLKSFYLGQSSASSASRAWDERTFLKNVNEAIKYAKDGVNGINTCPFADEE